MEGEPAWTPNALRFKRSREVAAGILLSSLVLLYLWLNEDNSLRRLTLSYHGPCLNSGDVASAAPEPQLPKVALLFLTRGAMPLRRIWRAFLEAAAAIPPAAPELGAAGQQQQPTAGWAVLFSIYTHPHPNFSYLESNLFAGTEVPGRVAVQWGQSTMVVAERALLRAALADPLNQRFVLLSESCIPLYPPATIYWQLMSEQHSRVNWCINPDLYRWQPELEAFGLVKSDWRKASQWKALIRKHAELAASDEVVLTGFHKFCWGDRSPPNFCVPDEHYLPTLLVHLGLEAEVNCHAGVTHALFDGHRNHPQIYGSGEATRETLAQFRGECQSWDAAQGDVAKRGIREALRIIERQPAGSPTTPGPNKGSTTVAGSSGSAAAEGGLRALLRAGATLNVTGLPSGCPLFARKIAGEGASEWLQLLEPILTS